jgi:hypothetical protein
MPLMKFPSVAGILSNPLYFAMPVSLYCISEA